MSDFWRHPADDPPPRGEKILLYTIGHILTVGHWKDSDCLLWAPKPKLSKELKERLSREKKKPTASLY